MRTFILTVTMLMLMASTVLAAPPALPKYPTSPVAGPRYKPATTNTPIRVIEIKPESRDRDAKPSEAKNTR